VLDVGGRHAKKLLASEDRLVVESYAESILKLHQATNGGVADLLMRHDPAVGVMVSLKRKRIKKELSMLEKKCQNQMSKEALSNISNGKQETTMPTMPPQAVARGDRPKHKGKNSPLLAINID